VRTNINEYFFVCESLGFTIN